MSSFAEGTPSPLPGRNARTTPRRRLWRRSQQSRPRGDAREQPDRVLTTEASDTIDRMATVLLVGLAFAFAWSIGSHYTGACMGMPYALGAVSARTALLLMAPLALAGAALASGKVATTVGTKLIDAKPTVLGEVVIVGVAFGVPALSTLVRTPPPTIQILVGWVVGVAAAASVGVHGHTIGVLAAIGVAAPPIAAVVGFVAGKAFAHATRVGG